ncbi:MAG: nucleoside deaminase [Bacteroidota bacterium]|nr:nucleoside deaminase [Bacteroidota bacterium]
MLEAIRLSAHGMNANEGGPFGCVIVRDGTIIGRGNNKVSSTNDPTAHAEVTAIRDACKHLNTFELQGSELYTSCEPCPMCLAAIYWAHIDKVYYGCTRHDAATIGFDDEFLYEEISKALVDRTIPIKQMLQPEAFKVFESWMVKPDKIDY